MGLIFAEFVTSLKSPKIDTAKNKPYYTAYKPFYTSSLRVLEIAKIELSENLTHLPSVIFAKISRREKFPLYGKSNLKTVSIFICLAYHYSYIPWNYHQPEKDVFHFEGEKNVELFINTAHEVGLLVILRAGPYICGEWDFVSRP